MLHTQQRVRATALQHHLKHHSLQGSIEAAKFGQVDLPQPCAFEVRPQNPGASQSLTEFDCSETLYPCGSSTRPIRHHYLFALWLNHAGLRSTHFQALLSGYDTSIQAVVGRFSEISGFVSALDFGSTMRPLFVQRLTEARNGF